MIQNNIKIELYNGELLDYESPESLGIKLNRVVDDLNNPSKRFGEFSYTFNLPKSKNNIRVFEFPDTKGRTRIFIGKSFQCRVFNGSELLLDGLIELQSFDSDSLKCLFYSKVTQLLDDLKGKKLVDMISLPTIPWDYEQTIIDHLNGSKASEHIEFGLCFYRTFFMQGADPSVVVSSSGFISEANLGYHYNYVNSFLGFTNKNPLYFTQLPPQFYLTSLMNGMLEDAGWSLGGSFFQNPDIRKIVIPFVGDSETYSGAIVTGVTTYLNLNKLLPDVNQTDFLSGVINAFNLYFTIDPIKKQINFETYNTLFGSSVNPYDVTNRLDLSTVVISNSESNTRLSFSSDDSNELALGFNRVLDYKNLSNNNPTYFLNTNIDIRASIGSPRITDTYNQNAFENLFNKVSGDQEIKIEFSASNYFPYTIINEVNITGGTTTTPQLWTIGIPLISPQTPQDNNGYNYAEDGQNFAVGNDGNSWSYDGGLKMYYYYGAGLYDFKVQNHKDYKSFLYINIATGGTATVPTSVKVPIHFLSPFKLLTVTEKSDLISQMSNYTGLSYSTNEVGAEAHSLLTTFYNVANTGNTHTPTSFSLTLGSNPNFYSPNLYSEFHQLKYDRLENGHILKGVMQMNSFDWKQMQINRTIRFNDLLYQLVSIKNYDPVDQSCELTLLRKL